MMIVLLIQGITTAGYDPVRQTISELGTGWDGTRILAIYGAAVLLCVWEPIEKALPRRISTGVLVAALVAIAAGCIGLAETDAESGAWNSMKWGGRLHLIFAFVFVFAAIPAACLAAFRALPAAWRGLRIYSLLTGLGCLALLVATLAALGAARPDPYVVSHLGLIERVYVFAFLIWQCIVSARVSRSRA